MEYKDLSKWKKATTKDKVDVYSYSGDRNLTGLMGIMESPHPYESIMTVLADPDNLMKINSLSEEHKILEEIDNDTKIMYMKYKGMFVVSGREFVV